MMSSNGLPWPRVDTRMLRPSTAIIRTPDPPTGGMVDGALRSGKGTGAGYVAPDDECLDIGRALVRVERFDVDHVSDDVVLEQDAVPPADLASHPTYVAGFPRFVQLREGGDRVGEAALLHQAAQPKTVKLHRGHL